MSFGPLPGAAALLLLGCASLAHSAPCLRYEPEQVSLEGTLHLRIFAGPPHYASMEAGDQPEMVWMLALAEPVCVLAIPDDRWNTEQTQVLSVQIAPRTGFSVDLNGKAVLLQGTLYRPRSGHPHADLILRATQVAQAPAAPGRQGTGSGP